MLYVLERHLCAVAVPDLETLSQSPFLQVFTGEKNKLQEATVELEGRIVTAGACARGAVSPVP